MRNHIFVDSALNPETGTAASFSTLGGIYAIDSLCIDGVIDGRVGDYRGISGVVDGRVRGGDGVYGLLYGRYL